MHQGMPLNLVFYSELNKNHLLLKNMEAFFKGVKFQENVIKSILSSSNS